MPKHSNLYQTIEAAWAHSCKPALIHNNIPYSFGDLNDVVSNLENFIHGLGFQNLYGLKLSSTIDNSAISIAFLLICAKHGMFYCPLSPDLTPLQLDLQLSLLQSDIHFSKSKNNHFKSFSSFFDFTTNYAVSYSLKNDNFSTNNSKESSIDFWESPYLLTSSSGSTGDPKLIVFSQSTKLKRSLSAIDVWKLTPKDIVLNASPIYHSLGQRLTLLPLILGSTQILITKFTADKWINCVLDYGVTFTIPVSPHLLQLSSDPRFESILMSKRLKALVSSSSSLEGALRDKLTDSSAYNFYEMYGASEIGTATVLSFPSHKNLSVGKSINGVSIRILDQEHKHQVDFGVIGEIYVKSDFLFSGYLGRKKLTHDSFVDCYFATGDLGYIDNEGYLYFKGRKNDCFKVGGINVYCSDIQDCINLMELNYNSRVVPIFDDKLVQRPVVILESSSFDPSFHQFDFISRKVRGHCVRHLAPYQIPLHVLFINKFPSLSNGKPDLISLKSLVDEALRNNQKLLR